MHQTASDSGMRTQVGKWTSEVFPLKSERSCFNNEENLLGSS